MKINLFGGGNIKKGSSNGKYPMKLTERGSIELLYRVYFYIGQIYGKWKNAMDKG